VESEQIGELERKWENREGKWEKRKRRDRAERGGKKD